MGWAILAGFALTIAALLVHRWMSGRREPGYRAHIEYWVYCKFPKSPPTTGLMDRMVARNPHNRPDRPMITQREGLLFTDIRLHVAAAIKEKNLRLFRPDLFSADVEFESEALGRLSEAPGMVRVRYQSSSRLADDRHLRFVPHAADAIADLQGGLAVFDPVCETLVTRESFRQMIEANPETERASFHLRILWREEPAECWAETRGMAKVGLPEMRTDPVSPDQRVLASHLLERAAASCFRNAQLVERLELEAYEDRFVLSVRQEGGSAFCAISRVKATSE